MASSAVTRVRSRKRAKEEICRFVSESMAEQPLNLCVRDVTAMNKTATADREPLLLRQPLRRRKKRSAIFLPPEKLSSDVCICKFKFVSGKKPRLQEKKILSVDAGGNFRFFPEPSPPRPTESMKPPKTIPELLPIETVLPQWSNHNPPEPATSSSTSGPAPPVKRLSRRQKIEKTFGEQGFLIQTQHVPATEGSAFCKFRQLKKFTRYLYRSWRHYLPEQTDEG